MNPQKSCVKMGSEKSMLGFGGFEGDSIFFSFSNLVTEMQVRLDAEVLMKYSL